MKQRQTIFDSRKSTEVYIDKGGQFHRSSTFEIPPGYVALVELTTHKDYFDKVTFTAIRQPRGIDNQDCFDANCVVKRYHQTCDNDLGSDTISADNPTQYTDFAKSVLRWGRDAHNDKTYQYHYITRPGDYFLTANKVTNTALEDMCNPTIIEMFLVPATHNLVVHSQC